MAKLETKKKDDLALVDDTNMHFSFIDLTDQTSAINTSTQGSTFNLGLNLGTDNGSSLVGTAGIDTVKFAAQTRADVTLTKLGDIAAKDGTVTASDRWQADYSSSSVSKDGSSTDSKGGSSTDSKDGSTSDSKNGDSNTQSFLTGIERVQFTDTSVALDLEVTQNAGSALALLYAGFDTLPDAETFGKWIAKADSIDAANGSEAGAEKDAQDMAELGQSILDFYAPEGVSNEELVTSMYHNILGVGPNAAQLDIVRVIENGSFTQGEFFALAAGLEINTVQYTGVASNGLEYTPDNSKQG